MEISDRMAGLLARKAENDPLAKSLLKQTQHTEVQEKAGESDLDKLIEEAWSDIEKMNTKDGQENDEIITNEQPAETQTEKVAERLSEDKFIEDLEIVSVPTLFRPTQEETEDDKNKVEKAKQELKDAGIVVDNFLKSKTADGREINGDVIEARKETLRGLVDKMETDEPLTIDEQVAAVVIGYHPDILVGENQRRESVQPIQPLPEVVPVRPVEPAEPPRREATPVARDEARGAMKWNIQTEAELNRAMLEISRITDPAARARRLGRLSDDLYNKGKTEWGNAVSEERTRQVEKKSTANVIGLPENRESESEWRKWARARMARLLDPLAKEGGDSRVVFGVISETPFGRQNADGSLYMPKELAEEIVIGKTGADGRVEKTSEFQVSQEMGKLYSDWRKAHRKLNFMVTAIESGEYRLPDNRLNRRLLNELKSEDGRDPEGGSKNIAKALQIYWAMAHSKEVEGQEILGRYGLGEIKSIFNNQLSIEEIGEIRNEIAGVCGGTYYENIGLMYASFYGVTAYGSDSTLPRIEFADAMGNLVHSEINRYKDDNEKFNATRRGYRYLGDTVANSLYEVRDGKRVLVNGEPAPVEIGAHSGSLQTQVEVKKEPRAFYILRNRGTDEKFRVVKKISVPDANGVVYGNETTPGYFTLNTDEYEEVLFDDLIKGGRINEIDWGKSVDVSALMISREKGAINVYKMFKNLDDELAKLNEATLIARKENFEDALPQYNIETQHHVMYLWLHSLINKNEAWRFEKKDELALVIKNATKQGLISENEKSELIRGFRLGILGDATKLTDGTYSPKNMFKSIFGMK